MSNVELKENGSQIEVKNQNKNEYVNLITKFYLVDVIKDQVKTFCEGFNSIISHDEIKLFSTSEFDLLVGGIPHIEINDIKENVIFDDELITVVDLFLNAISKWNQENLAKLLLFVTGSSVIPVGGLQNEKKKKDFGWR